MLSAAPAPRATAAGGMGRDGLVIVGLVVLCQVAHFLTFAAIPLLLPLIREDLGLSFTQAGALSAAGMVSYALMQIPAGYLSDRYGPQRLFFIGLTAWSALCVAFGFTLVFWPALVITPLACGVFGALVEMYGLRRVHRNGHIAELLFSSSRSSPSRCRSPTGSTSWGMATSCSRARPRNSPPTSR